MPTNDDVEPRRGLDSRWPRAIRDLKPSDFFHGEWMTDPDGGSTSPIDGMGPDDVVCGTRCCLVGWTRISFGLQAPPAPDFTDEAAEFLIKFLEFAGYEARVPILYDTRRGELQTYASDCFEGKMGQQKLSREKAASAWKKTREHFGYTEVS